MEELNQKQDQNQERKTLAPDEEVEENWSEHVENLVDNGDTDGAIAFLERLISRRDGGSAGSTGDLQLSSAMSDLADLYSSKGYTIKADELRSRAFSIRARMNQGSSTSVVSADARVSEPSTTISDKEKDVEESTLPTTSNNYIKESEDVSDWEEIADKAETDMNLLSLKPKSVASPAKSGKLLQKEHNSSASDKQPKRKGRGSFLYDKSMLYSDTQDEFPDTDSPRDSLRNREIENEGIWCIVKQLVTKSNSLDIAGNSTFGTRHVLVLYGLPTNTRTTELEKIFEQFEDAGVAIRWVNDTSALAVFRNPSLADSAKSYIPGRYKFRCLHSDDELLTKLKSRDLEPPYPRPKTNASAARRIIGQTMGIRMGSPGGGVHEHKQQERERKERIITRQALRDDAWGSD